jgi:hypothetical protein
MQNSRVITVPVRRPWAETYALLRDPENYPNWSPISAATFERVSDDGLTYRVDLPRGRRLLRFTPDNPYGVLDYTVLSEDGTVEYVTPLRAVPNGEGTELIAVFFQRPGASDEVFASEAEWAATDFRAIAAALEKFER